MASPFIMDVEKEGVDAVNEKLIKPAVDGTTTVLESVAKHKASIKCCVLTSSCAAVSGFSPNDKPKAADGKFTEEDWNETSTREAERGNFPQTFSFFFEIHRRPRCPPSSPISFVENNLHSDRRVPSLQDPRRACRMGDRRKGGVQAGEYTLSYCDAYGTPIWQHR